MFMCSSIQCMGCKSQNFSFLSCFLSQVFYFYFIYEQFCWSALGFQCGSGSIIRVKILQLIKKSQNCFFISPGHHEERQSYKRSLQPSKENIQHFKTWNISTFSIFLGPFCPPGSESAFPVRSRIQPAKMDPDPQPDYKYGENVGNILQGRMLDSDITDWALICKSLKVHKRENFFGSDFEFFTFLW